MSDSDDCRVLVVDDAKEVREMLCLMLRVRPGFVVVGEAANGREAIDVARETQPDVVFLDLAMPVMDGLEALPEIRRVAPASKVLVSSGYDDTMVRRAVELGAHATIVKGGKAREIADAILQVWRAGGAGAGPER
ncbi:MAG TPA: response regulator transcription factor [Candidatus Dormibacteraeota bacterium]